MKKKIFLESRKEKKTKIKEKTKTDSIEISKNIFEKKRRERKEKNSQVVKEERAYGGCLGTSWRGRTQQTAKRFGEW